MNSIRSRILSIAIACILSLSCASAAYAYWVWTPDTKKFINPKYAVKDSPKEQYDYAMGFYDAKDYARAATEFDKLVKNYEFSEYAGKAQYHVGLCYENQAKYYLAFQAYQKAIDNFPHLDNVDEIIAREFNIAGIYEAKESPKVLGTDIMTPTDRVVEIYRKVVDNAPYGKLADQSLYNLGQVLKKAERYDEAIPAFQKILDEYPSSQYVDKARYEVAYCAYKASLRPAYDQETTDKAIKAFSEFSQENADQELTKEADKTIRRLKDKAAEKSLQTAQFYEKIRKKESAIIYYQDIIDRYPDCSYTEEAKVRIEELRTGRKRQAPGAAAERGGLFSIFPAPAPAPAPGAVPPPAPAKKGWLPSFGLGRKAAGAPAPVVPAPAPAAKKGWFPSFGFGKKEAEPAVGPATTVPEPLGAPSAEGALPAPQSPVATEPVPLALPGAAQPQAAPAATLPSAAPVGAAVPAAIGVMPAPVPATPVVAQPVTVVSRPEAQPKRRVWSPLGLLGLQDDTPPAPPKPVVFAAKAGGPDAPAVALEPSHGGADAVARQDDINVEMDGDDI